MESFCFGDSPEMSETLLNLVVSGKKTATSWASVHGDYKTVVGEKMIVTDYENNPKVIIQTTDLVLKKFQDVDESFAKAEGEGDLSLEYWQRGHREYFTREGTYPPRYGSLLSGV